ncbi:PREDICTED: odorant receptor 4-like [Wasmannia auropunctata]|uniref:odorant receptor 4-like n=1 Tax=Wasmannia auropunctata TaxID=64793 RepID=UPI0005EF2659|nr:PREDICTED: odorant receptor 4-like [Wasmannia auropunctata]
MFFIVSVTIAQYCHYLYFIRHMYTATLGEFMDCLSIVLAHSKVLFKCVVFWINQRKFIEVLTIMREDWSDCANDAISTRETTSEAKASERITNLILILHTITVSTFGIGVLLADVDVTNTTELPFMTKIEIPFDIDTQRTYKCIVMTEFFCMFMWAWSSGAMNSLLLILEWDLYFQTFHVAGQINIVRCWLTQLAPSKVDSKNDTIAIAMAKIIQKHKKIIRLSENIESLFTNIALMLFVSNSIMICLSAFQVVMAIGSVNATQQIVKSVFFYIITNLEAYIFCYAGEHVKNKSKEISFAAYDSAWYDMKAENSHVLLFIILRSQKQLTLTAGKMMELSLKTFTSIMNASGSYLSMLLAMQ